jgi:FkbM family methyltransferase
MTLSMRKCGFEGVKELLWIDSDMGAYGNESDGPLGDWIQDKEYFMEKVKKFDVVVQAGGNCGMYARFYKNYFQHVYTFEPDDLNFYCLDKNCVGDGYTKIKGGLGNTKWKLTLKKVSQQNVGMHKIENKPGDIQMYRIDDLNLEHCDLIHLDVEGYEPDVIKGAIETIKKFSPVVITERSHGAEELKQLGYKKYRELKMDTVFIKE